MTEEDIMKIPVPDCDILTMLSKSDRIFMLPGTFDVANDKMVGFAVLDKDDDESYMVFLGEKYWLKHKTNQIMKKITHGTDPN